MSKFCPKCTGLVPNSNMTNCPNCGADLTNVTEDVLDETMGVSNVANMNSQNQGMNGVNYNMNQMGNVNNMGMQGTQTPNPILNFANSNIFKESGNSAQNEKINLNDTMMMSNVNVAMLTNDMEKYQNNNMNNQMMQQNNMNNQMFQQNNMNNQMFQQNNMNNQMFQQNNMNQGPINNMPMNQMPNNGMMNNMGQFPNNNGGLGFNGNANQQVTTGSKSNIFEKLSFFIRKNPKFLFIAGGAGVALIILIVTLLILSTGPKALVNKYVKGAVSFDANKVLSTMHPKVKKDLEDTIKEQFYENKDYAKDYNVKIKKIKIDGEYEKLSSSDVKKIASALDMLYGISDSSIKEVRRYNVEIKYKKDGEDDDTELNVVVFKIGSKWYVYG